MKWIKDIDRCLKQKPKEEPRVDGILGILTKENLAKSISGFIQIPCEDTGNYKIYMPKELKV